MDRVTFKVNGVEYSVGSEVSSNITLLDYVRGWLELKGTKYMCRQAGCGACVVTARRDEAAPYAINSCMMPVTACHGLEITTIEDVGNRRKGYHPLQTTLANYNGSQCGYCSPGWVMAMYSLLQNKKDLTMLEIEKSLSTNICRCTGYRSILDAFKTFAKDAPKTIDIPDIEDLNICKRNTSGNKSCDDEDWCIVTMKDLSIDSGIIKINLKDGKFWYKVNKVIDIFKVLAENKAPYKLICGNTAKGVYPNDDIEDDPQILIDINEVKELKGYILDQNLIIGAESTLSELINIFEAVAEEDYFNYLKILQDHVKLIAHLAVRNVGSIAGNLMIKHRHNEFQSDIFLLFETVAAQLTIASSSNSAKIVTMQQFLKMEMKNKVILNVMLPPLNKTHRLTTFKIMPRSQNAHAIVHSGFLYKLTSDNKDVVQARIVFGGLSPSFIRASVTERFLIGKALFQNETLQAAINILKAELVVTEDPPEPSVAYRMKLALGLFYKGLLTLCPETIIHSRYKSGRIKIHQSRPVSKGQQTYETSPSTWPLNQPIPKREGLIQCAGEATYTDDIPPFPNEVYAAFVLTTVGKGHISTIDASDALSYPGVIAFFSARDIPGLNSFTPADDPVYRMNEEVFCSGQVKYYNQPVALVVADSQETANTAAKFVNINYTNVEKPVVDVKIAKRDPKRNKLFKEINATQKGQDIAKVIKGDNTIHGQYHFSLETLVSVSKPIEEGVAIYATTQWTAAMQLMVSRALKLDQSRIDVHVRRIGGAFGIKISRIIQTAVATSLVALKLNLPCRIIHTLEMNTRALGKRFPCSSNFEAGVNKSGVFQYLNYDVYEDNGYTLNENLSQFGVNVYNNCYNATTWNYKCIDTITDTAKNTWFRSPGTMEHIAMVELMMEQISYKLSIDPVQLRLANLDPKHNVLVEMYQTLVTNSDYATRRLAANKFNAENRWKKRGLRFVFLRWEHIYARYFDVNLAVYQGDGTIVISHGGVEMGQGINTKAAQIAAYMLKVPIEKVIVKENNTVVSPNSAVSGGSLTTQNMIIGVEKCCEQLLARLEPVRKQLKNPTWEELIKKSYEQYVDLQAHGFTGENDMQNYEIYGVTLAEVEIDVLTGESEILRVDILQDVGRSVNPALDIGQAVVIKNAHRPHNNKIICILIEGAFVMGLGYWTCEKLVYDSNTGELLTDRTWNYYVPQARDIPQDFRIYLKKKSYSTKAIFGSKACSEPPICMTVSIPIAMREAIVSARLEAGLPSTHWFSIDGPLTTEQICLACETKTGEYKFY